MTKSPGARGPTVASVLTNLLPAALFFLLFAAVGIVHVTSRVMVVDAGYRLSRLEQESRALAQANDKLKLELATLKSPLKLERLAREQLGMAPPSAAAVVAVVNVGPGAPRPAARKAPAKKVEPRAPVAQRSSP